MKNLITTILILSIPLFNNAQSSLGSTDDMGRIAIAAIVPDAAGIPGGARTMLQSKLQQIATQNGLSATEAGTQFAMVPMVSIISQDLTPTAPPQHAIRMEISLFIVDLKSKNIFSQTTIPMRGVGRSEEAAYSQGIRNINPRHGQFRGFVETGKEKIIEYYNSQCNAVISAAQALAGQQRYEEAMATLFEVPDVSRECYDKSMNLSIEIYQQYANQKCNQHLAAARSAWAGKNLMGVEENLAQITPDMGCYPEASELLAQVAAAVEAEGASAWDFKMKVYEDNVDKEKLMIEAGRDVARSWGHRGAAAHMNWDWRFLYPNADPPATPAPTAQTAKAEAQPAKPVEERRPPMGERPKASDLVVPIFQASKISYDDKIGFEQYPMISSNSSIVNLEGVIRRQFCVVPEGFSPLEIVRFYQKFIEDNKGIIVFQSRDPRAITINGKPFNSFYTTQRVDRGMSTYVWDYHRFPGSISEYLTGKIYTDRTELYILITAGRGSGGADYQGVRFEIVTVEVKQ